MELDKDMALEFTEASQCEVIISGPNLAACATLNELVDTYGMVEVITAIEQAGGTVTIGMLANWVKIWH